LIRKNTDKDGRSDIIIRLEKKERRKENKRWKKGKNI
jgi:hypothetical protein